MACKSECMALAEMDLTTKKRLMKANQGNEKFRPGQIHPQCDSCIQNLLDSIPFDVKMKGWQEQLKALKEIK